jgi:hypothetical protein
MKHAIMVSTPKKPSILTILSRLPEAGKKIVRNDESPAALIKI